MDAAQLDSLYNQFNNYILQHFVLFWSIILGVLAVIGVALFFIARSMIRAGVRKGLDEITEITNRLERRLTIMESASYPITVDLQLCEGVVPFCRSSYSKSKNGIVEINISVEKKDETAFGDNDAIGILPVGFRPKQTTCFPLQIKGIEVQIVSGNLWIEESGIIRIKYSSSSVGKRIEIKGLQFVAVD